MAHSGMRMVSGRRFVFFGGKGGVGKTTCAAAHACRLAETMRRGDKALLISTDPAHSLSDILGQCVGAEPTPVEGLTGEAQVFAVEVEPERVLRRFHRRAAAALDGLAQAETDFDPQALRALLEDSLPGLDQALILARLLEVAHAESYARIVVDTAPTAQTLRLLAMPALLARWIDALDAIDEKHTIFSPEMSGPIPGLFLAELQAAIRQVDITLRDPDQTRFVLVSTAEPAALAETSAYLSWLDAEEIAAGEIVLNQLEPPGGCRRCDYRRAEQQAALREVQEQLSRYRLRRVSRQLEPPLGPERLRRLADELEAHPTGAPVASGGFAFGEIELLGAPHDRIPVPDTPLVVMAGKGGAGKTTVAAAVALEMARRHPGRRTLLLTTEASPGLAEMLGGAVGTSPAPVPDQPGLWVQRLDARGRLDAFQERYRQQVDFVFGRRMVREDARLQQDGEIMSALVDLVPPGLDEVLALGAVLGRLPGSGVCPADGAERDVERWDHIVLDPASTGHLMRMLDMPALGLRWVRKFSGVLESYAPAPGLGALAAELDEMAAELEAMALLLRDERRCCSVGVALPELTGVREAERMLDWMQDRGMAVDTLLFNKSVLPHEDCERCEPTRNSQTLLLRGFQSRQPGLRLASAPLMNAPVQNRGHLERFASDWRPIAH